MPLLPVAAVTTTTPVPPLLQLLQPLLLRTNNPPRHSRDTTADPKEKDFIHCLLASCDYDSFYSVMVREARNLEVSRSTSAAISQINKISLAAEGKEAEGGDGDGAKAGGKASDDRDAKGGAGAK